MVLLIQTEEELIRRSNDYIISIHGEDDMREGIGPETTDEWEAQKGRMTKQSLIYEFQDTTGLMSRLLVTCEQQVQRQQTANQEHESSLSKLERELTLHKNKVRELDRNNLDNTGVIATLREEIDRLKQGRG
jgi:septal ring factor EnvC (AmiA/AmiB activator)